MCVPIYYVQSQFGYYSCLFLFGKYMTYIVKLLIESRQNGTTP